LGDSRFAEIFNNPDFQVDESHPEFLKFNTAARVQTNRDFEKIDDGSDASSEIEGRMSEEEDESLLGGDSDRDSDADDQLLTNRYEKKDRNLQRQKLSRNNNHTKKAFHAIKPGRSWDQVLGDQQNGSQKHSKTGMSFSKRLMRGEGTSKRPGGYPSRAAGAKSLSFNVRK
jgi:ribosome biogenesis protein ENP2